MKAKDILQLDARNIIGVCLDVQWEHGYVKYNYIQGETVGDCISTIKKQVRRKDDPFIARMSGYSDIRKLVQEANENWNVSHNVLAYRYDTNEFFYADNIDTPTMTKIPDELVVNL